MTQLQTFKSLNYNKAKSFLNDPRELMPYGHSETKWNNAKEEIRNILIDVAKTGKVNGAIYYSELTSKLKTIQLEPNSYALHHLLGDISTNEDAAGRGMLSVIVISMADNSPGQGFFTLAKSLGRNFSDQLAFQISESEKVYEAWSTNIL